MPYEFLAKNGLISQGNITATGSLTVTQNISASRTGSFGAVAIGTNNLQDSLTIGSSISESLLIQNNTYNNLSNGIQITSNLGFLNGASANLNFARWTGTDSTDHATIGQSFNVSSWDLQFSTGRQNTGSAINYFTSSAVRMTIKAVTGNVGIGTTSPLAALDVRSQAMIGDASIGGVAYQTLSIGGHTRIHDTYRLQFGSANGGFASIGITGATTGTLTFTTWDGSAFAERLRIVNTNGNVGIGTTTVSRKLHTYTDTGPVMRLQSSGSNASIEFIPSSGHNRYNWLIGAQQNISDAFEITPSTATDGTTFSKPSILVKSDGNVGIGTTSPAFLLDVSGSSRFGFTSTNTHQFTGSVNINGSLFSNANITASNISASGTSSFGYVGIGTNSPVDKLTIISGSTRIASTALAGALYFGSDTSNIYLQRDNNYDLSLVQNGDSNSALYLASAGNVYLNIDSNNNDTDKAFIVQNNALKAGTELFRVQENGSVGIGTSIPNNKLDVVGGTGTTIGLSNSDDVNRGGKLSIISGSATGRQFYVGTTSAIYNLVFGIDSIEKMRLDTSGYFAINTTNTQPYSGLFPGQLVVDTGTSVVDGIFSSTNQTNAAELILTKKNPTNNFGSLLIQHSGSLGDAITLNYNVNTSTGLGGTNSFKVTTDGNGYFRGNVGIGTTNPGAKLDLYNGSDLGSGANGIRVQRPGSYGQYGYLEYLFSSDSTILGSVYTGGGASGFGRIFFRQHSSTTSRDAMVINTDGNVGIGSTSPGSKLEVLTSAVSLANQPNIIGNFKGDTDGRSLIRVDNTYTSAGAAALQAGISFVAYSTSSNQPSTNKHEAQIILGSTGATSVSGGQTGTLQIVAPLDIAFNVSASNTIMTGSSYTTFGSNAMYIARSGNVGIGTTSPTARLHVSGSTGGVFEVDTSGSATTFYVSASGNIGIGTTNPNGKLHVVSPDSTYAFSVAGATKGVRFNINSTGTFIQGVDNTLAGSYQSLILGGSDLYFQTNGVTNAMYINSSGNVGIGSTSPAAKFVVFASAIATTSKDSYAVAIGNSNTDLTFGSDATYGYIQTWGSKPLYINNQGNNIIFGANVGIGTTNPASRLQIGNLTATQTSATETLSLGGTYSNTAGSNIKLKVYEDGGGGAIGGMSVSSGQMEVNTWTAGKIAFYRGTTQTAIIDASGNVGIGTTSPSVKLHVSGSSYFQGYANVYVNQINTIGTSGDPANLQVNSINIHPNSTTETMYIRRLNSGNFQIQTVLASANSGQLHLQPYGGSVGIGTTSPAFLLDVSGSSRFGFTSTNTHQFTGSVSVSNNVTCLSLTETSTEAVKYNIVPLPSQLENVLKLTPVSFNYKTNNKHSIGLIAEEVAKIYPEFTSENNDSISYGKMTSVLIQSIKELKSIIDTQQKQIEELLNKFKQL